MRWVLFFLLYTGVILAIGSLTGTAVFLLLGKLFIPNMAWRELGLNGMRVGAILAGIWGPGVAIVLCFIKGHRERQAVR